MRKLIAVCIYCAVLAICFSSIKVYAQLKPEMYFSDSSNDVHYPNAKDPDVIAFKGHYLMYYSIPAYKKLTWRIGVAESTDLIHWQKAGEIRPQKTYEKNGICAAGALVKNNKVHLFYQTYGNGSKDAICHAVSPDGIHFMRDQSNPVFHPSGKWTCGRAIDAEVVKFKDHYRLYFATRDTSFKTQKIGVALCADTAGFHKQDWRQVTNHAVLFPQLSWEKDCIEAPSCLERNGHLYMFYAGAYNNAPQQIGVAVSKDGIHWKRLSKTPFLSNGLKGSWNESESGHPCIFKDVNGNDWLFYQGNNTNGKTWFISKRKVNWKRGRPYLASDDKE